MSGGSYSPFGAKALVRQLGAGGRGGPVVTAVLADPSRGEVSLELENEGGETARDVEYHLAGDHGDLGGHAGQIAPGGSVAVRLNGSFSNDPVECVWMCRDDSGRRHVWSYDGRHERLKRGDTSSVSEQFQLMYRPRL